MILHDLRTVKSTAHFWVKWRACTRYLSFIDFSAASKKHDFKIFQIPSQAQRLGLGFGYAQKNSVKLRVWSSEFGGRSNHYDLIWSHRFLCSNFRNSCCFSEKWSERKSLVFDECMVLIINRPGPLVKESFALEENENESSIWGYCMYNVRVNFLHTWQRHASETESKDTGVDRLGLWNDQKWSYDILLRNCCKIDNRPQFYNGFFLDRK